MAMKFTPAASTRMSTWPGPGEGSGRSSIRKTSGPPVRVSYELTRTGRTFGELAQAIERWGRELVAADAPRRR